MAKIKNKILLIPMLNEIKKKYHLGNVITKLLIINIGIFVLQSLVMLFFTIFGKQDSFLRVMDMLYFPNHIKEFLRQPWSIFTYQFLHTPFGIFHVLFNMLFLFFFGRIFTQFMNPRYVFPLYITGGVFGALLFMITFNMSPAFQSSAMLVGASASILAIVVAAATLVPDYTVFLMLIGPVKLKWIALVALLIDIINISSGSNAGGHIAHLGGAMAGFFFIISYRQGYNWFGWIFRLIDKYHKPKRNKPRVAYVRNKPVEENEKKTSVSNQKRVDQILDKISKSGYDSLTKEEKEFLFKVSNDKK
ncbi:MAG: rhomboid family intramembrane serine protease [Bacteroidetes bacterium]|nr:rhomboid family intramembrane serine protease [Bacteroidota bacterium]MBP7398140.1 rhomboid family intramembrane serine protease [Chitinophagales bacterium]MBK8486415.1 rhomboid family intramembrane serine protease [Bacteroidota bacterium]MBK8683195.1 rhomboid family intramembrane serine protease [Bacteroidota bacterium]MBP8753126.1 rhomboid family intramembrane serine protease [Chitinophagales bacterium]